MKHNRLIIFNVILLAGILVSGCSTLQRKTVEINKSSFDIKNDQNYPISNIHVINESGELFLKGSVSRRFGKSPLLSGHIDIKFINVDGQTRKKECVFLESHYNKRSCEKQANFEMPVTEDLLASNTVKIEYVRKEK